MSGELPMSPFISRYITAGSSSPAELLDRSAIWACVEKNRLVQAGQQFTNFQTDTIWTTRGRKIGRRWSTNREHDEHEQT
jgi:hypothetical protein